MDLKKIKQLQKELNKITYSKMQELYSEKIGKYTIEENRDLIKLFNYNIHKIEGFEELDNKDKRIVEEGILLFIDGGGLLYKHTKLIYKIEKEYVKNYGFRFKLFTLDGYSWLYEDLTIG